MLSEFKYANPMMCPLIEKVVVNIGVGRLQDLRITHKIRPITGKRPIVTRAKKSIAS